MESLNHWVFTVQTSAIQPILPVLALCKSKSAPPTLLSFHYQDQQRIFPIRNYLWGIWCLTFLNCCSLCGGGAFTMLLDKALQVIHPVKMKEQWWKFIYYCHKWAYSKTAMKLVWKFPSCHIPVPVRVHWGRIYHDQCTWPAHLSDISPSQL